MSEENKVVLHGTWSSPYTKRVELALKLKGIPFQYVEEDLRNKSVLLLKYNPVHKKVPVLVHNEKPIVESLVILDYIDETWKNQPRFLPDNPYGRAKVRFWSDYIHQLLESNGKLITSYDTEAWEKACQEVYDMLDRLEEGMKDFLIEMPRSTDYKNMDLLDIMLVVALGPFRALEEVLGIKILDQDKHPLLYEWVTNLVELPVVKETWPPPHDSLVSVLHKYKQLAMNSRTN